MTRLNWEKAAQRDRLRKQGTVRSEAGNKLKGKKKKRKRKKVHPNSTAATKWGRKDWKR